MLSVIVPVYNTADYLQRCLSSIAQQTYPYLEIICVDDGSTDGSEKIVDEFAAKDKRFVVKHQENGGESKARNAGLSVSTGEYITFVDCDDWLEPEMYEVLIKLLEDNQADISACSYSKEDADGSHPAQNIGKVKKGIWNQHDLMEYVYHRDQYRAVTGYIWCKIYRRNILQRTNGTAIGFNENLVLGGDVLFFAEVALNAHRIIYTDKSYYHYLQRKTSGFHSCDANKWKDMILTYQMVLTLFEKNRISDDILIWVKRFLAYRAEVTAKMAYQSSNHYVLDFSQNVMRKFQKTYEITNQNYYDRISFYRKIINYSLD